MGLSDKDPQVPPAAFFSYLPFFSCHLPAFPGFGPTRYSVVTSSLHRLVYATGIPGILGGGQRTARTCFCSSSLPLHLAPPAYSRHQTPAEVVRVFIYHQQRAAKSRNCGQCIPAFAPYSGPNTCVTTISHNRAAIPFGKRSDKVQGQDCILLSSVLPCMFHLLSASLRPFLDPLRYVGYLAFANSSLALPKHRPREQRTDCRNRNRVEIFMIRI